MMMIAYGTGDDSLSNVFTRYRLPMDVPYVILLIIVAWRGMTAKKYFSPFLLILHILLLVVDIFMIYLTMT
jgi:hypothetical protein